MKKDFEAVVRNAMDFIESNLSKPISVEDIAGHVNYSGSRLGAIFKKLTGTGAQHHITRLRMERARHLLRETKLDVTQIAYDVGFQTLQGFVTTFRRKVGMPPSAYRHASFSDQGIGSTAEGNGLVGKNREWLRDDFGGHALQSWWEPQGGDWTLENGSVIGQGEEAISLSLGKPLPENFDCSFEIQFPSSKQFPFMDLNIVLWNNLRTRPYCSCAISSRGNEIAKLLHMGVCIQTSDEPAIKKEKWIAVNFRLRDDTIQVLFDHHKLFEFRDPFPAAYSSRCGLGFESWGGMVGIRKLRIHDIGFMPLVRAVRQGDSLFNFGIYDGARNYYKRLLDSDSSLTDAMELRYKIGMSFRKEGALAQALSWLDKVVTPPERDFWAQHAQLAILEIELSQAENSQFQHRAKALFNIPSIRSGVRELFNRAMQRYQTGGFEEKAIALQKCLLTMEDKEGVYARAVLDRMAACFTNRGKLKEVERILGKIESDGRMPKGPSLENSLALAHTHSLMGKIGESERGFAKLRERTENHYLLSRCGIYQAFNLRAKGQIQKAIELLDRITHSYPGVKEQHAYAKLEMALLQCMAGQPKRAEKLIKQAKEVCPWHGYLADGSRSRFEYVPYLLEGKHTRAARLLLEDCHMSNNALATHAEQGVKAGILFELGGNSTDAEKTWHEAAQRFPLTRCCYFASLAESLLSREQDCVENMPFHVFRCSEMIYLVALLQEKRGNKKRSRQLLELCIKKDPTLRWPAWFARQKIAG